MKEFDPGDNAASIVSVTDRVRPVAIGMPVAVHGGGILSAASDGERIVMGGDDGKLVALDAKGEVALIATDPKRRWIDNVALHPDGAVAWSAGKTAFVRGCKGEEKSFDVPSTDGGLTTPPRHRDAARHCRSSAVSGRWRS